MGIQAMHNNTGFLIHQLWGLERQIFFWNFSHKILFILNNLTIRITAKKKFTIIFGNVFFQEIYTPAIPVNMSLILKVPRIAITKLFLSLSAYMK